jgi:glycosyltransferase involved in cell wall biosynthesis
MMRSRGFEVYHYGVETSESGANKQFDLLTKEEWNTLRIESLRYLDKTLSLEDATKKVHSSYLIPSLMNWSIPLSKEFNRRLRIKLQETYRGRKTDIICLPLGRMHEDAVKGLDMTILESGIGYSGSFCNFRIFESHAWMSKTLGLEQKSPQNYWFVIPNYFDTSEFKLTVAPTPLRIGFLGRITTIKGCGIIVEIAKRFPHVQFVFCGSGDPTEFLKAPNIQYKEPIHGEERSEYLGSCVAVLCLSKFLEPFCGVAVEAQLCGTPVICSDWGGLAETVEQYKTGLRGHTLADYCQGVQMALEGVFDRTYIRERAVSLFDMYKIAHQYEYVFKNLIDIYTPGKNGWYSTDTHIPSLLSQGVPVLTPLSYSNKLSHSKPRLHIPAIPYTITREEYSHDAFTNKVRNFSSMMRSCGFEVYHYGIETSESGATKQIDLLTKEEWTNLRIQTLQFLDPKLSWEDATRKNQDPGLLINIFSNWSSPLTKEFNRRFRSKLIENYQDRKTDIVCIPLSKTYHEALEGLPYAVVETGIGYEGSCREFRIFESYAWMSHALGVENKQPQNYWFVIPHAFNIHEFSLSLTPTRKIGFLGRIVNQKGCGVIKEIAKRFPEIQFVLCGQGDPSPYLDVPNIEYKPPIHGDERSTFLGDCIAVLYPVKYLEPFGCGPVEAQLCGTPVICSDWGGMVETVEQGRTGLRCHTLADYCHGIQMALDGAFDRTYIRERAVHLYDMKRLAHQYEYVFKTILDVYTPGKNGWYSPDCHLPIHPRLESNQVGSALVSKKDVYAEIGVEIKKQVTIPKDIFVFGTCRVCYPIHDKIQFVKELRKYHSRYYKINDTYHIYTEPVNYTTKLVDVLDSILYMKGKLYNNLNPKTNKMLQSIFFRGHITDNDFIAPHTHPNTYDTNIIFGKIIIEIFSIKQYILNTKKYGDEFYLKNLPWKLKTGYEHNGIIFDESDFIVKKMNKEECFEILNKIKKEVCCDILIIGPYISKKVPEFVNNERIETQTILKEYCSLNGCDYFDVSEIIKKHDIELDETHFNNNGIKELTKEIYKFIVNEKV